jgi:predicted RNA-binding protein YlqC (UPF0109 family)
VSDIHDDYEAGDINTIDADDRDGDNLGDEVNEGSSGTEGAETATAVLEFIAKSLAEDPSAVSVEVSERHDKVVLSLSVGPNDMGRIIGRRGRTAQAIRALVGAAGARDGVNTSVDIVD